MIHKNAHTTYITLIIYITNVVYITHNLHSSYNLCNSYFKVSILNFMIFFLYIKMANEYYQKHKERLWKEAQERYQNQIKKKKKKTKSKYFFFLRKKYVINFVLNCPRLLHFLLPGIHWINQDQFLWKELLFLLCSRWF